MEKKKIKQWLTQYFKKNNIDISEIDILLCEVLKCDFSKLILIDKISYFNFLKIKFYAQKRTKGMPITKIFHRAYFFKETFYINKNVLSPRPETELLVEKTLDIINKINYKKQNEISVLDLCCGSGVIAVSIKQNYQARVFASDISQKALNVAKKNANKHKLEIFFVKSNMFEKIDGKFDIIVSNPPYIETDICKTLDREVKDYDPLLALDGGKDGLDFYRNIAKNGSKYLNGNGIILVEIGFNQRSSVENLFLEQGFDTICYKDYSNNDRIIVATKKE